MCAAYGTDHEQRDAGGGWDQLRTLGSSRGEVQLLGCLPPVQSFGIRNCLGIPAAAACWLFEAEGLGLLCPRTQPIHHTPLPGSRGARHPNVAL